MLQRGFGPVSSSTNANYESKIYLHWREPASAGFAPWAAHRSCSCHSRLPLRRGRRRDLHPGCEEIPECQPLSLRYGVLSFARASIHLRVCFGLDRAPAAPFDGLDSFSLVHSNYLLSAGFVLATCSEGLCCAACPLVCRHGRNCFTHHAGCQYWSSADGPVPDSPFFLHSTYTCHAHVSCFAPIRPGMLNHSTDCFVSSADGGVSRLPRGCSLVCGAVCAGAAAPDSACNLLHCRLPD